MYYRLIGWHIDIEIAHVLGSNIIDFYFAMAVQKEKHIYLIKLKKKSYFFHLF